MLENAGGARSLRERKGTKLSLFPLARAPRASLVPGHCAPYKGRFTRYNFVACDMLTTSLRQESFRVISKSNLQLACDCRVRHEECHGLLKHVLKPYDNRSDRQFYIVEIVYDFSMTRAARAIKIACDNRKQKSYRVNRP